MQGINRQIVLSKRPHGMVTPDCFAQVTAEVPEPGPGQALLRVLCVAIDPAIRGWINPRGSGYLPAVELGEPVRSNGVGVVVKTRAEKLPVGSLATALTGWQEYALAGSDMSDLPRFASPLAEGIDPVDGVTVFGQISATAYAALTRVVPPEEGQTFLVSAAASGVGSLAGQIRHANHNRWQLNILRSGCRRSLSNNVHRHLCSPFRANRGRFHCGARSAFGACFAVAGLLSVPILPVLSFSENLRGR